MANTTFTDGTTVVNASWLNDINDVVYDVLGDGVTVPTTVADVRTTLDVPKTDGTGASGTWDIAVTGTSSNVTGTVVITHGGTGQTTASAGFDALKQSATTVYTGVVELATSAEAQAGTDAALVLTPSTLKSAQIQLGTAVASTSGTAIDFTGIPSWAKRVTVMFNGVSTSGTSPLLVRIGTSSGIEATSYVSMAGATTTGSGAIAADETTGFRLDAGGGAAAASARHGTITISNHNSNRWTASGTITQSGASHVSFMAGSKSLAAALDRVRITAVNGTDTFDAGSINISWE